MVHRRVLQWILICCKRRAVRGAIIGLTGASVTIAAMSVPEFHLHPIGLFYAYALFAAWYGDVSEGALALALVAINLIFLSPSVEILSTEAFLFMTASVVQLLLIRRLRQAQLQAERARYVAEVAVRIRDDFLTTASHDLRTPLTVVVGRLTLLENRLAKALPGEQWLEPVVASMKSASTRIVSTVEEFTDVAYLRIGQELSLRLSDLDLVEVVEVMARTVDDSWLNSEQDRVVVDVDESPMFIQGDRARLERVMQNVIGNAVKYSPDDMPVKVELYQQDGWVTLSVRDHGVGIPHSELRHVFEPFYRASTSIGVSGSGIGLAGVKAIVEAHHGRVEIDSLVGEGTTVTIMLPCVQSGCNEQLDEAPAFRTDIRHHWWETRDADKRAG